MAISDLNPLNPTDGTIASGGAQELRDMKTAIKASFPAFTTGVDVCNLSGTALDNLAATVVDNTSRLDAVEAEIDTLPTNASDEEITGLWDFTQVPTVIGTTVPRRDAATTISAAWTFTTAPIFNTGLISGGAIRLTTGRVADYVAFGNWLRLGENVSKTVICSSDGKAYAGFSEGTAIELSKVTHTHSISEATGIAYACINKNSFAGGGSGISTFYDITAYDGSSVAASGITVNLTDGTLQIGVTGVYEISFYANVRRDDGGSGTEEDIDIKVVSTGSLPSYVNCRTSAWSYQHRYAAAKSFIALLTAADTLKLQMASTVTSVVAQTQFSVRRIG